MIASVTELRLKNFWCFLKFIPHAVKCNRQAARSEGLVSMEVGNDGFLIQRTLTVWQDEQVMLKYVRTGAHLEAMKAFRHLANKSYTARYNVERTPTWEEALKYLKTHGREHG